MALVIVTNGIDLGFSGVLTNFRVHCEMAGMHTRRLHSRKAAKA
jgi:hypothetical protein